MGGAHPNAGSGWHGGVVRGVKEAINFDRKVRDAITEVSMALQNLVVSPAISMEVIDARGFPAIRDLYRAAHVLRVSRASS